MSLPSRLVPAVAAAALLGATAMNVAAFAQDELSLYQAAIADLEAQLSPDTPPGVCEFAFQRIAENAPVFRFNAAEGSGGWRDGDDVPVDLEETPLSEDGLEMIALNLSMFDSRRTPDICAMRKAAQSSP